MKNLLLIGFLLAGTGLFAQKSAKLTIDWVFTGIVKDYDHNSRMEVYVDGAPVATSTISKQSEKNKITIPLKRGQHTVKIVNYAEYQGEWEAHTRANDYSLDAVYEYTADFNKKSKLSLVFDIEKEIVIKK